MFYHQGEGLCQMPCEDSHDIWLLKNWYVDPLEDGTRVPKYTVE